jgi:tRNA threonylcarbamoyladenosine biosynthesis protein TsaE
MMDKKVVFDEEVSGPEKTCIMAEKISQYMIPGSTILLYGDLGSGKTFLVKQIAKKLGIVTDISSPSFAIIHQHAGKYPVYHIDLYRIHDELELINLGLDEILASEGITFVEWPQIIENQIIWPHYRIHILARAGNELWRKITFSRYE